MKPRRMVEADYLELGLQPPPGFFPLASGRAFKFGNKLRDLKKRGWSPPLILST